MTGCWSGCIARLEEMLGKPLQWAICLLHCIELPLRHVFKTLDGVTKSPDTFSGPIGKCLNGSVSDWEVVNFKRISNPHFPEIPPDVVQNLSTDQYYGYRMATAVIVGEVDEDLALLEVGEIFHARWLTLACRILRYYVSVKKPSSNLKVLAEFVIKIYFPSWFEIKYKNKLTEAAPNFYNIIDRVRRFPSKEVKKISLKVLQRNGFSIHSENVLLAMLADTHEEVCRKAVNKILALHGVLQDFSIDDDGSWAGTEIDANI